MGNTLVCLPQTPCSPAATPPSSGKLVNGLTGHVQHFHDSPKVAEIMLENPGNFVCNSNCFGARKRFEALPADQELKKGQLYFILPMHKRNKRASAEELDFLGALLASSTSNKRSIHYSFKVSPCELSTKSIQFTPPPPSLSVRKSSLVAEISNELVQPRQDLLASSRSWKPNLQTISERPTAGCDGKLKQLMERPTWAQECLKVGESVERPLSMDKS